MKIRFLIGSVLVAGIVQAGQPLPPAVIYGQIRDERGYPMDSGAVVAVLDLSNESNECGSCVLDGDIYVGINYRISVPLEDVVPFLRSNATLPGSNGKVVVRVAGAEQPTVPAVAFTVPEAGNVLRMDFSLAQDMDGDGLPDAWEELMVAWSEGVFSSINDIDPNADSDGDGMSNWNEYLAGTFPFLATDIFEITRSDVNPKTGRIALTFTTVSSRKYHILVRGALADGEWQTAASSASEDGVLEYQVINGSGREMVVYVDGSYDSAFFRVGVN